jgi:hypothetical protein
VGDVRHSTELGEDIRDGGSGEVGPIDHAIRQVSRRALLGLQGAGEVGSAVGGARGVATSC